MQQSVNINPQKIQKATGNAIKHYKKLRIKDARKQIATLLSSNWPDNKAFFQTGIAAYEAGDVDSSIKLYEKAITLIPKPTKEHSNLFMVAGTAYSSRTDIDKALELFDTAIKLDPKNGSAFNNRALCLIKCDDTDQALDDLKNAHALSLNNMNILINLGDLLIRKGKEEEALELYKNNLPLYQNNAELHYNIANILQLGSPLEAFQHYRAAVHQNPKNNIYLHHYSRIFEHLPLVPNIDSLGNDLLLLLSSDAIKWNYLNRVVRQYIRNKPNFQSVLPLITKSVQSNCELKLEYGQVIKALSDNVVLAALKKMRLGDPEIEKILELFRRQTLAAIVSGKKLEKPLRDLLGAFLLPLAHYSFFTEFLFVETEFEINAIDSLLAYFEKDKNEETEELVLRYLILSCYRQCHKYPFAKRLLSKKVLNASPDLANLIKTQIAEPLSEQETKKSIKQLTNIENDISQDVREQYEENPYPRWQTLPSSGSTTYTAHLAAVLPVLQGRKPVFPENPQVLIAGCGTGRQPISSALAFPETSLLAIDLSQSSISYAMRKAKEMKVKNIAFGQADIMELGALNRKFNIIECAGVLHHMDDPVAGWKILYDLLEDDGYMNIGLYSELGRKDVVASRTFIKERNFGDSINDIRECRKELMALDKSHPAARIIHHNDFYTTSACRDLIFHVQEHRFTVPKIIEALDQLGLEFLGFNLDQTSYLPKYVGMFPDDKYRTNLENWNSFEEQFPDVFSTMYKFWVRKKR